MNRPPIYFVVPVWGDAYVDVFLDVTLPALLSPNNIPGATDRSYDRFDIYTTAGDYNRIVGSPLFAKLERHVHTSVHITDAARSPEDSNWEDRYTIKSDCYRAAIQRAAVMDAANFMLNADIVLSDGFVKRVAELLAAGKRVIELPGPRTLKAEMVRDLKARTDRRDGVIAVPARELVTLAMKHLHPLMKMHIWGVGDLDQPFHPSHLYWRIGKYSLLARCFHLYPIVVHPRDIDAATEFDTTIDDDLVEKACPDPEDGYVVTDSDEMFCCELSGPDHYVGEMARRGDVPKMVEFYHAYGKSRNWTLLRHEILIRGGPIDEEELQSARAQAETLVGRILKRGGRQPDGLPKEGRAEIVRAAKKKPPLRFLLAVWGEKHSDLFLDFALPSLLAPGNIPRVVEEFDCVFTILTMREDVERFRVHPAARMLSRVMPIKTILIDDLEVRHSYGIMLTAAFARGIAAEGAAATDTHFVFLNADFLFSDGSLTAMLNALKRGRHAVLAPSFRCISEEFTYRMAGRIDPLQPVLSMSGRDLVGLALDMMHPTFEAKVVNQDRVFTQLINQFLWKVDDDTYIGRFFLMFMLCIKPERVLNELVGFCDYAFVPELVPSGNIEVLTDSDDIFILELQHRLHESEFSLERRPPLDYLAGQISEWSTGLHRQYSGHNLLFHRGDTPLEKTQMIIRDADAYLKDLHTRLTEPQPYRNHQYWDGTFATLRKTPQDFPPVPPRGLRVETLVFPQQGSTQYNQAKTRQSRTGQGGALPPPAMAAPLAQSENTEHSRATRYRRLIDGGEDATFSRAIARAYLVVHGLARNTVWALTRLIGFTVVRLTDLRNLEALLVEARHFGELQRKARNDFAVKFDKAQGSIQEYKIALQSLRFLIERVSSDTGGEVDLSSQPDRRLAIALEKLQTAHISYRRMLQSLDAQVAETRRLSDVLEQERADHKNSISYHESQIAALRGEIDALELRLKQSLAEPRGVTEPAADSRRPE